jgi:hypothetical protein
MHLHQCGLGTEKQTGILSSNATFLLALSSMPESAFTFSFRQCLL